MTLGEIIKEYRQKNGLSMDAFSKKSGISKSYISLLEKNKHPKTGKPIAPSVESIKQAAKGMGMRFDDLFALLDSGIIVHPKNNSKNQTVNASRIPVLGRVRCGIPLDAIEDVIDYEEVPEKMNYDGKLFGLRVKGDSMYPPIRDGDTLIVHEQPDAETNEIVIAMVNGNEATCKELKKVDDGIMLVPWNRDYDAMFFSWQQVQELPVRIVGKVVEFRSKV